MKQNIHATGGDALTETFTVYVDDNFHYMDEDERHTAGVYPSYEDALNVAKGMLTRDLEGHLADGKPADEWLTQYMMFGEDPWISPTPEGRVRFSAHDYARELHGRATASIPDPLPELPPQG